MQNILPVLLFIFDILVISIFSSVTSAWCLGGTVVTFPEDLSRKDLLLFPE